MKVAHLDPQTASPDKQLTYKNLFGACHGGEGNKTPQQYCDTAQGSATLTLDPTDPKVELSIHYMGDGTIKSDIPAFDREIDKILNLNYNRLKENRKAVLESFTNTIPRGLVTRENLTKWLRHWNGDNHQGELEPYCQIVVYWLRKKLHRAQ
jgi:hypothetical protein